MKRSYKDPYSVDDLDENVSPSHSDDEFSAVPAVDDTFEDINDNEVD